MFLSNIMFHMSGSVMGGVEASAVSSRGIFYFISFSTGEEIRAPAGRLLVRSGGRSAVCRPRAYFGGGDKARSSRRACFLEQT